jgi:hypothetical protein
MKATGFPFIKVDQRDIKSTLLEKLASRYKDLSDVHYKGIRETGGNPARFDDAAEGHLHTLLLLGIHYQKTGKRKRARELYRKCRSSIEEYEKRILEIPDHITSFNLRKVKEVLEENRSSLEGEGF